jgi:hypothetical protein
MRPSRTILAFIASVLAAASVPVLAGNYAEGDPRPQARTAQISATDVAAQTRQWMASAPTLGYPEGNPRASVQVGQKTRAQVQAEAVAWVASGMSQIAYGEAPVDSVGPSYRKAAQAFDSIRAADASAPRVE